MRPVLSWPLEWQAPVSSSTSLTAQRLHGFTSADLARKMTLSSKNHLDLTEHNSKALYSRSGRKQLIVMYVSKVRRVMDHRMSTSSMQFCWKRCSRFLRVQEELQSSGARDGTCVCTGKAAKTTALCFSQTFVSFQGAQSSTCFLKKTFPCHEHCVEGTILRC